MTLIDTLRQAEAYPHPVSEIQVIETHISWLFLTGDYAYKVKKPVDFGFLDFTTLEKRKLFCEEELRLNQRLAPDIYESVVPICGTPAQPAIDGEGEPFEYAVRMRQFNPEQRLDLLLQAKRFEASWIDTLAEQIADFHDRIPRVAPDSPWGEAETIWEVVSDNFLHIGDTLEDLSDWGELQHLSNHTAQSFRELTDVIKHRKAQGHVRECHGDLHLANITLYHDELRLFDCIEFNLQFRWIDTICDLAFLLMDLEANDQFRWANRCLNRYLELCGDYDGVQLLNFYKSYRAMVRAKVSVIGEHKDLGSLRRYLGLTGHYARTPHPVLYLMHGVSGTGKSHFSQQLLDEIGAIRIRSDVERKRLYRELSLKGERLELYGAEMNARTLNHLQDITRSLLRAGYSVIVDATHIRYRTRQSYFELSQQLRVPMRIVSCQCEQKLIEARLKRRVNEGIDASDADIRVMRQQLQHEQRLNEDELDYTIVVDTDDDDSINYVVDRLRTEEIID
ncbi:AAA family ATPase [Pontibacterium sp.]|uniref:bifunctional aminoglycoside phosphotransferase/ATP-binding protein n=1 Tax=Pontibacterium sp. TaxID=2036026 RepID=UPI0035135D58